MSNTSYPSVNNIISFLHKKLDKILGKQFIGMYLNGSLALDDFVPDRSDIDIVIVTQGNFSKGTENKLKAMHKKINSGDMQFSKRIECIYIPIDSLKNYCQGKAFFPCLHVGGDFHKDGFGLIEKHVLREKAKIVKGPKPKTFIKPVKPDELKKAAHEVLKNWWLPQLSDNSRLKNDDYQVYAILTMCRSLYTIKKGDIVSKSIAVDWAVKTLDEKWTRLINNAFSWKIGNNFNKLKETLDFIKFTTDIHSGVDVRQNLKNTKMYKITSHLVCRVMIRAVIKNRHNKKIIIQVEKGKTSNNLVFIAHGLSGFKEQRHIKTFAKAFKETGFTVVSWDATNSLGESGGKLEEATLSGYYQDFEDVIKWAKKQSWYQEPFVLNGHSLGAACCILYTTNYPNRVKALAPISAFLSGKRYCKSIGKKVINEWKTKGYIIEESVSRVGVIKKYNWSTMKDLLKYELFSKAKEIKVPTLLIVGSLDSGTPLKDQKRFFNLLATSNKELHTIKGAPHTFIEKGHLNEIKKIIKNWEEKILRDN